MLAGPLELTDSEVIFRDIESLNHGSTTYQISSVGSQTVVWDITNPLRPKSLSGTDISGSTLSFGSSSTELKSFAAFDINGDFPSPVKEGDKLPNQNYHGIDHVDMVIVY